MGAIQEFPLPNRRESFRSRLHRALSLSSSETEDRRSPSRSAAGDTTEDDEFAQEEDDHSSGQRWGNAVHSVEEDARHDWNSGPRLGVELSLPQEPDLSGKFTMIAFQCMAELDTRMKSMQNSLSNQTTWNETIRSDLDEIRSRLAAVEAAIEMTTKEGENTTARGNTTRRTRRS
ncbi:hypothetical protein N7523_001076 [Penicillium sp. IBT 18751x]|nr:hypothetical protein N7523_001076 [Penicillium sp. IBT 18751x]